MSRSMTSERIVRLNLLLKLLRENQCISSSELISRCGYVSGRNLESDLRFMRESLGAKIRFSRSMNGYILEDIGDYVISGSSEE